MQTKPTPPGRNDARHHISGKEQTQKQPSGVAVMNYWG
jgi:hypothetical protein